MSMPAWEIPFDDIGKVLLALPEELTRLAGDVTSAESSVAAIATAFVAMLTAASMAISDKGLNFSIDASVAKAFLALLAQLKSALGSAK